MAVGQNQWYHFEVYARTKFRLGIFLTSALGGGGRGYGKPGQSLVDHIKSFCPRSVAARWPRSWEA